MTVDEETKLDVVAKTKKNQKKNRLSPRTLRRARVKVKPNRQSHEIHPHFIHPSLHPSRAFARTRTRRTRTRTLGVVWVCVDPLTNPRFTTRQKKSKESILARPESRRGARPKRAWFFPSIQPSSHASDATDATDARERRRRNPMHRKYIDRSIDARVRADGPTRGALARFCAHAFDDTTDGWNDGWMDGRRPSIHSVFVHESTVRKPSNIPWVGSTRQTKTSSSIHHPAVRACVSAHPSNHPTHTPRRRDATRREYDDVPIDVFFLCNFNVRFRVT